MLNDQKKKGGIDWTDYTWNPISGCLHGCDYCYMRRMEKRFKRIMEPKFKPKYLKDISKSKKLKSGDKIFVGSSGDMWGKWVKVRWMVDVMREIRQQPRLIFQFLTKNPSGYGLFNRLLLKNMWCGTTVDGTERTEKNIKKLIDSVPVGIIKFVSFEPLLAAVDPDLNGIDWVIIGANSNRGAEKPPEEWANRIIKTARLQGVPVFMKDNYGYPVKIKNFPLGVL